MICFNSKYQIEIDSSQEKFIEKLSLQTIIQKDFKTKIVVDKKKDFIGEIEYDKFKLTRNKSSFVSNNYTITGIVNEIDNKIEINGKITGYKFTLSFVIIYTILCFFIAINNWVFMQDRIDLRIGFTLFTIIGIINYFGIIRGLKKFKTEFLNTIKNY